MFTLGFFGLFGLLCLVLWIWAIVDIINSRFREDSTKIIWILLVIFLPFLGTLLHFVVGREQRL
ncbi:MAG: PLDc_N domain-containing protein [Niastella sp.]|nr:PLDc_N domain-containing protein [Niastella sp.]